MSVGYLIVMHINTSDGKIMHYMLIIELICKAVRVVLTCLYLKNKFIKEVGGVRGRVVRVTEVKEVLVGIV